MRVVRQCWQIFPLLFLAACTEDEERVNWRVIHATVIQPSCATAGCHSSLAETYDLDLEPLEESYEQLVREGFVVPGRPDDSRLMYLLWGIEVRKAMPPDQPLPEGDVDLVERWIRAGAPME